MPSVDAEFDELFERLRRRVPFAAGFIGWIRKPWAILIRIPLAIVLILGGVLSFLPVLGVWMLPLGLLILAVDVRFLRRPVVRTVVWIEYQWNRWRQWRQNRRQR